MPVSGLSDGGMVPHSGHFQQSSVVCKETWVSGQGPGLRRVGLWGRVWVLGLEDCRVEAGSQERREPRTFSCSVPIILQALPLGHICSACCSVMDNFLHVTGHR